MASFGVCLTLIHAFLFALTPAHALSVATGTPQATEAALETLKKGGNAADAAIAAVFVMNVAQPANVGIGGGGFFLAEKNGVLSLWNSRETAPASAHEKMFLDDEGAPLPHYPDAVTGPNGVGVPGLALGLWEAHKALGALPWKALLQPAIRLANQGLPVNRTFEETLAAEWPRLALFPTSAALFGDGYGSHIKAGRMHRNPLLARTLEIIAEKGAPAFYRGPLAESWVAEARKLGVRITPEDLKNYKVEKLKPIQYEAFGLRLATMPLPSAAALVVGGTLRYLEHRYKTHRVPAPDSAQRMIVTTEALTYFQDLRQKHVADPPHATLDPRRWFGSADERAAWVTIDKKVSERLEKIETAVTELPSLKKVLALAARFKTAEQIERGHTAHLSVIDDRGMAVSYTGTIEEIYGSAITVTGHGFILNNELTDFTKEPGLPNSAAPGKRPRSNMSPHLVFDKKSGKLLGALGCAGGGRIPTMLVLALENYFVHKLGAREAAAFPRFHPSSGKLLVERSMPRSAIKQLKDAGYDVEVKEVYGYPRALGGTLQAILRRAGNDKWESVSEPRADGTALSL